MNRKLLLVAGLFALMAVSASADQIVEEIVARVNDSIITRSDLQREKEQVSHDLEAQGADRAKVAAAEKDVLRDMIDQQLMVDKAKDAGVNVDDDVIKQLDKMRIEMGLKDLEELQKAAEAQGISFADYRQNLKNRLLTQRVIQHEVGPKITVTPEEKKAFYDSHQKELTREEQVRLSEILVSPNPEAQMLAQQAAKAKPEDKTPPASVTPPEPTAEQTAAAQQKADQLEAELKKGAKFADLAKKESNGPSAAEGGDLGYFKRGILAKELEDRTFNMKVNDISEPILTKQGYVILTVTEHIQGGVPPMKSIDNQLEEAVYMDKMQPVLRTYLTQLREEAYIDIKPGYVDSGASPNETKPVVATGPSSAGRSKPGRKKKLGIF